MQNSLKILGAFGAKEVGKSLTSIQVSKNIIIDAGNIISALGSDAQYVDHIFLTHCHLDHIVDIPFLIDGFFEKREKPLFVYGSKETIQQLKSYIFNWNIWPDFSQIELQKSLNKAIEFVEIEMDQSIVLNECKLTAIKNNHSQGSCGYIIEKNGYSTLLSSDTYLCSNIWDKINADKTIGSLIIEVSFPSKLEELAQNSKHLTPTLLKQELQHLKRDDVKIYINHMKPIYKEEISEELKNLDTIKYDIQLLADGDIIDMERRRLFHSTYSKDYYIEKLNDVGYALTSEKNLDRLMEKILTAAKQLTNADAGTFYLMSDDEQSLQFVSVQTDSLNIKLGGSNDPIPWPNLYLYNKDGSKNNINVSVSCALNDKLINIDDVYKSDEYTFEGPKAFDSSTGYRTKSMLVVPMKNHENDVIGVLQLINKEDQSGMVVSFTPEDEKLILSMSSQAAIIVTNAKLIYGLENLLNSFIQSIATAIGEKSKYTAGHINRVAEISTMIAEAINSDTSGRFKDKFFTKDQLKELDVASWMHDIGKITTPEYVVDKSKKLETIYDRINTIEAKFEILKQQRYIKLIETLATISDQNKKDELHLQYESDIAQFNDDFEFIRTVNTGGEFLDEDSIKRIESIAKRKITINQKQTDLLTQNEVYNLSIKKGTLTDEERFIINNHAKVSYDMLNALPFPKKLRNVPSIAGGHHEKIAGGGYPFGLKGDEISFESRILAIADIFEALTAHDRPYKKPNTLNQSMRILYFMAKDGELDKDLVKFFVEKKLHLEYAKFNLMAEQMDEVTVSFDDL